MMKVYTNIKTLAKVERLLADLGVLDALYGRESLDKVAVGVEELLTGLLHGGKLQELMEIITRDSETDFEEMDLAEIRGILASFFTGIVACLPAVIKANVEKAFRGAEAKQEPTDIPS